MFYRLDGAEMSDRFEIFGLGALSFYFGLLEKFEKLKFYNFVLNSTKFCKFICILKPSGCIRFLPLAVGGE